MPQRKKRPNPKVGTSYEKRYKGKSFTMTVIEGRGKPAFVVKGREFSSPSAAAKEITKSEVNGWAFWGIDEG